MSFNQLKRSESENFNIKTQRSLKIQKLKIEKRDNYFDLKKSIVV